MLSRDSRDDAVVVVVVVSQRELDIWLSCICISSRRFSSLSAQRLSSTHSSKTSETSRNAVPGVGGGIYIKDAAVFTM
jgi:hypothetical protein